MTPDLGVVQGVASQNRPISRDSVDTGVVQTACADLDAWASRLLGQQARVLTASAQRVEIVLHGGAIPIVSDAEYSSCPCASFLKADRACGGCGRPACRHLRALARMRKALRAQGERALLGEIRRLGAAGRTGQSTGAPESPSAPAPARLLTARADD